ncbi:hypothetical protein OG874_33140 [Nocardia sp. NBC_00565]|uniref:hypothetical protein n=1 Tax=Nocardia sp. NBC_00565 TaxID=2975993 RepID=UPI002E8211D9|nr:hypothetical protein [Nocardia sp. NBC_00565]WUC01599.1 hypothetical protein OG874_33140 [Nocardia sp. NBC_00565]
MRIKSLIAAGLLTTAVVAGVSASATASAATGYYYRTYATYNACAADGASPKTGGNYWQCVQTYSGWDLYLYN